MTTPTTCSFPRVATSPHSTGSAEPDSAESSQPIDAGTSSLSIVPSKPKKWRGVIQLLPVAKSIALGHNVCAGTGTLQELHNHNELQKTRGPHTAKLNRILVAIATILARDSDVVAVASFADTSLFQAALVHVSDPDVASRGPGDHRGFVDWMKSVGKDLWEFFTEFLSNILVHTNPNMKHKGSAMECSPADTALSVVKPGISILDAVITMPEPEESIFQRYSETLTMNDYLATVIAFFNTYRDTSLPTAPKLTHFFAFLIANCLPKMKRRVLKHPFTSYLESISTYSASNHADLFQYGCRLWEEKDKTADIRYDVDRSFIEFISSHDNDHLFGCNNDIDIISEEERRAIPRYLLLTHPLPDLDKFRSEMKLALSDVEGPAFAFPDLYNAANCFVFQLLVDASFTRYAYAILRLHFLVAMGSWNDHKKKVMRLYVKWIMRNGTTIWKIVNSKMFRYHCEVLAKYTVGFPTLFNVSTSGQGTDYDDVSESSSLADRLVKLGHLFVSQFEGVETLKTLFSNLAQNTGDVDISIIAARKASNTTDIEGYDDTIRSLFEDQQEAETMVNVFKSRARKSYEEATQPSNALRGFLHHLNNPKKNIWNFKGNLHCEAVLASLPFHSMFPPPSSGKFVSLQQLVDEARLQGYVYQLPRTIAVSKLCCPVCWDLLGVLSRYTPVGTTTIEDCSRFNIRGRHDILTPVDLPGWLPEPILEEMLSIYIEDLRSTLIEIRDMCDSQTPSRTRKPSHQLTGEIESDHGISSDSCSNNSHGGVESFCSSD